MATNDHFNVPPLPSFAIGALFFLQSGDFLLQYQTTDNDRSRTPLMKAGAKFVTVKDVQAAFGGSDVDSGWITPGVARCGYCAKGDWFVYMVGQQVLTLQVNFGGKEGLKKIKVPIPATVMVGMGMQYYLWAMARSGTPDSRLYRAPFPNIHDDGSICWGQNTPPKAHHRHAQAAWYLFFESQFNGDLANGKSGKYASDVRRMLKYVARKKLDNWPENDLVMHHQNLRYTLQEIVGASDGKEAQTVAKYILAETDTLPAIDPTSLYEFVVASNGVFVRARRCGLEAMIPISTCEIRGLQPVEPYVRLEEGKIPLICTQAILAEFQSALPNESLVWVRVEDKKWKVIKPEQIADENSVHPVDPFDPAGISALVDVHSHDTMEPFFSTQDDKDETGFRVFAVFGLLDTQPCIMARVGIYGYYWHLNAGDVLVLPDDVKDITELRLEQAALLAAEMEVEDGITAGCS